MATALFLGLTIDTKIEEKHWPVVSLVIAWCLVFDVLVVTALFSV